MINFVPLLLLVLGIFCFVASILLSSFVNKVFQVRISSIVVGVLVLIFFFAGKYVWYIKDFIEKPPLPVQFVEMGITQDLWDNILFSNLFLVSLPDLLILILGLSMVFDKTKNVTKAIAPYGLFFGLLYLFSSTFSSFYASEYIVAMKWYKLIFVSDGITRVPSLTFIILILISLWTLISCREFSRWSIFGSIIIGALMFLYSYSIQLEHDVGASGFGPYVGSKFNYLYILYNSLNPFLHFRAWGFTIFLVLICFVFCILVYVFKNLFTRDIRRINFIYKPWYYRSRIFAAPCYAIDGAINNVLSKVFRSSYLFGFLPKDARKIKMFVNYIKDQEKTNSTPSSINVEKVEELSQNMDQKLEKKANKKKTKEKKKIGSKKKDENLLQQPGLVQQWTDENGTTWGLDDQGKYFYFYQNEWIAYQ